VTVLVRQAVRDDAPMIATLFAAHLRAHRYTPNAELDADMDDVVDAYAAPACFLVAVARGELIAMAGIKNGELRRVFVREGHRRSGVGRMLIDRLVEIGRARGERRVWAVVQNANAPARTMFERLGFVAGERRPPECTIFERTFSLRSTPC
jgi:GNAT superfamily N-acetyltransferase